MGLLQDKLKEKLWTDLGDDLDDETKNQIEADFDETMRKMAEGIEEAEGINLAADMVISGTVRIDGKFAIGKEPINVPTIVDGDLASIQAALIALGIVKL